MYSSRFPSPEELKSIDFKEMSSKSQLNNSFEEWN